MIVLTEGSLAADPLIAAVAAPEHGGIVVFLGVVRADPVAQGTVTRLEYETHPVMTRTALEVIVADAARRFGARVAVAHRTGSVNVGETATIVAAGAPHREAAFAAARFAIEELKRTVPVWKREVSSAGTAVWVEGAPL